MSKIEERDEFKTMVQVGKISCSLLHDLISPITSLNLYTDNIIDSNLKEIIDPITQSTADIREFIKLIQDAIEKPNEYFRIKINQTIKHSLFLSKHKINSNNVKLKFSSQISDDLTIRCKKIEIYQLIMNLVGNAVDACSETNKKNKNIRINLRESKKLLVLTVEDNGCGIKKRDINKIFIQEFTTKDKGMGIGLYTVKAIVENSFKGKISVKSKIKTGTKFTIIIPFKANISKTRT